MVKPTRKKGASKKGAGKEKEKTTVKKESNILAKGDFTLKLVNGDEIEFDIPTQPMDDWEEPKHGSSDAVKHLAARGKNFVAFINICYKETGYKER